MVLDNKVFHSHFKCQSPDLPTVQIKSNIRDYASMQVCLQLDSYMVLILNY